MVTSADTVWLYKTVTIVTTWIDMPCFSSSVFHLLSNSYGYTYSYILFVPVAPVERLHFHVTLLASSPDHGHAYSG